MAGGSSAQRDESQLASPLASLRALRSRSLSGLRFTRGKHRAGSFHPVGELLQRSLTLQPMTFLAVTNLFLQPWQEIKCDVRGLEVLRVRMGHVVRQRSKRGSPWRRHKFVSPNQCRRVYPRHQPSCNRLHVAFHTADLSREQNPWMRLHLQGFPQQRWTVDIRVAMNLPVAQKPRILQSGNHPQHARLLSELQMILESDQIVGIRPKVFLPQLHDCI